ncbi:MAG TPA: c-type cytochrome [Bryobacteraceae bacterium]|nr:c-type cytochrome [Bryobacteraceae bacterium]
MRTFIPAILVCIAGACAQEKPAINKELASRGRAMFVQRCGFCHGNDARGNRAPDLVRSPVVLRDEKGEGIGPVIRNGRPDKGMPAFPMPDADIEAITAFLHSQVQAGLESAEVPSNYAMQRLLTGDAADGRRYFDTHCASCHSATGDLAGIASKYKSIDLEAAFLSPEHDLRTAVVTLQNGETVRGRVLHEDEFSIALRDSAGFYHSFDRRRVRAEINDPLAAHRELLFHYTDQNVHDIFAYLATLTGPAAKEGR